ncbi:MAG: segregation/condensation protein A [Deltaproteobacteria bacterium]|nr:segregation/condensation protein A [Deltaproteobacteria bacterium]MBW2178375.1 segregation/condensation protein A [Deltaproteobacteria bacterium]MBW2612795.1 segregation/condensation protein A [Deltaproteobacteria bacterium]
METTYQIKLEDVFEGPMDLLLHLIRKNEVDIYDIPIALITRQYIEYIDLMKMMSIDFAGDFLVMASTLAQIKSRTLLPTHGNEDEEDDPRMELTRPLIEYLQMKSVADQLAERDLLGEKTFARTYAEGEFKEFAGDDQVIQVGLFELIDAFQKILKSIPEDHRIDLDADSVSVKERITEIVDQLEEKGTMTFAEFFATRVQRSEIIVTFLALLEMVKLNLIRIAQHLPSGIIRIFYV